ncbi:MAG TPA: hypothetical protein VGX48_19140 [Pyrinomonadaceae bacterium]|jgi:hypothetical protein|nr:hypothetical protein [Pyrinomonadaceae bacterium]
MMKKSLTTAAVLVLALGAAAVQAQQRRGPSTPEERRRAAEIATLLENEPLHKDAKKLSQELLFFLIEVPDISVTVCTDVLGDLKKIKGDYSPTITAQLTFSMAKFVIEHPEQAGDKNQVYVAGVEGVLRAYQNIKKAKPKVEIKPLEELLAKQQAGQLADFVKAAAAAGCKE